MDNEQDGALRHSNDTGKQKTKPIVPLTGVARYLHVLCLQNIETEGFENNGCELTSIASRYQ